MAMEQIKDIVKRLVEGLDPDIELVRIYAYGSRVRGDYEIGSDLDLLVELRQVTPVFKRQIQDKAWELSLDAGFVVSVIIVSEAAFERGVISISELAENIRRHGVEITAA